MNKYKNGKIYKITDVGYTKFYIGSTIRPLSSRMSSHRYFYKKYLEGNYHCVTSFLLFDEFGVQNCKIELLEDYTCENNEQLLKKEGEYIKSCDCVNKQVAGRTKQEYQKDYDSQNTEHRKTYLKQYREQNKDKIKEYYEQNKDRRKEYIEQHKDRIKAHKKQYREQNKDKIAEYNRQKTECPFCKSVVVKTYLQRHQQANKCSQSRQTH
jgi:hypothetical protein